MTLDSNLGKPSLFCYKVELLSWRTEHSSWALGRAAPTKVSQGRFRQALEAWTVFCCMNFLNVEPPLYQHTHLLAPAFISAWAWDVRKSICQRGLDSLTSVGPLQQNLVGYTINRYVLFGSIRLNYKVLRVLSWLVFCCMSRYLLSFCGVF